MVTVLEKRGMTMMNWQLDKLDGEMAKPLSFDTNNKMH